MLNNMNRYIALSLICSSFLLGCNESKFLRENPEDFMSTSNSFQHVYYRLVYSVEI